MRHARNGVVEEFLEDGVVRLHPEMADLQGRQPAGFGVPGPQPSIDSLVQLQGVVEGPNGFAFRP